VSVSSVGQDNFLLLISGPSNVTFNKISIESEKVFSFCLQRTYSSELTEKTQVYPRVCAKGNYHYETIQINVQQNGSYTFDTFIETIYILVVTTSNPDVRGAFTLSVTGPHNLILNRIDKKHSSCVVGDECNLYTKGIGLNINDILRNRIQSKTSFGKQSVFVKTAAGITMIMFVIGLINGFFSLITFLNKDVRKVDCGLYLLASSITSLLTITMFTIKFWFTVVIEMHSTVSSSILQADCAFIGPFLKLCLCCYRTNCQCIKRSYF